jgi:RND family efflux transporter MFP subunit
VSGEVLAVHAAEGQVVRKGDPLLELVDTDYEREVALARVSLREAELSLQNAEVERRRKEQALASRGISEAEFDLAVRQVELAKVGVERARVQVRSAQDRLDYCKIASPIDGVVIRRNVEPGEMVVAGVNATMNGEAQLTIAQMDRLLLQLDLNQVDVARVRLGQPATVLLDAYPGEEVPGAVQSIAAAGHTDTTRQIDVFTVKVEVDPSQAKVDIKPGMTAEVRIRTGEWADVVKVPAEMVFEEDGASYVYVVTEQEGGKAKEKTRVEVGHRTDREVEITGGLSAGDRIYAQAEVKDLSARGE